LSANVRPIGYSLATKAIVYALPLPTIWSMHNQSEPASAANVAMLHLLWSYWQKRYHEICRGQFIDDHLERVCAAPTHTSSG